LNEVKEVSWLESCLVEDATLVHECKLVFIDFAIKVFVDFPDPLIDFWLTIRKIKLSEDSDHILLVDCQSALI
jgi:hypothetical protein